VNALNRMHTALRPGGHLLDLHPDALHAPVEVRLGDAIMPLGHLDETRHIHDVHIARAARQAAIDAGQFVLERETRFTFVTHFDSVDTWLTYMAEHMQKDVVPAELVARARELLPPGAAGEMRIPRQIYAARLWRIGDGSWLMGNG
jgi:hypothetical protein